MLFLFGLNTPYQY